MKNYCFAILLIMSIGGCTALIKPAPRYDTELFCPQYAFRLLLLEVEAPDVREAIKKAAYLKRKYNTNESYSVINLPNDKSFYVEDIPIEELGQCLLVEYPKGTRRTEGSF